MPIATVIIMSSNFYFTNDVENILFSYKKAYQFILIRAERESPNSKSSHKKTPSNSFVVFCENLFFWSRFLLSATVGAECCRPQ
jgi:hypothetical protein